MPALTRRRDPTSSQENWCVYFGDIRVGSISRCVGNPNAAPKWQWRMGFYPGVEPGDQQAGAAPTFEAARAEFEAAWKRLLPKLSAEDLAAYRRSRAFHEWKSMMWDPGCRMPTQVTDGRSRCFCGTEIGVADVERHVAAAHTEHVGC